MSDESAPDRRVGRSRGGPLLDVRAPYPIRSVLATGWSMILFALALAYLFAIFFPALGGLLLIAVPLAVVAAVVAGTLRARSIRLIVTDEVIRISSGKAGIACDRATVQSAVLVESLARRRLRPRTADLILLDRDGRTALLLSGVLWPPAILEQVIGLIFPVVVERVEGNQTPASLSARYPNILSTTDGIHKKRSGR